MIVFKVEGFDPVQQLIEAYLNSRDAIAGGKAVKDTARANGEDMGRSRMIGEALMFFATEQRIRKIQLILGDKAPEELESVGAPEPWEIERWISGHRHEYRKVYNEVSHGANKDEREKNSKIGRERQAAYLSNVFGEWITHVVWPEEVAAHYEARRRGLIRTGKMEPTQADAEWLAKELDEMYGVVNPLQDLVEKAKHADA